MYTKIIIKDNKQSSMQFPIVQKDTIRIFFW